jgi:hypothetical protein
LPDIEACGCPQDDRTLVELERGFLHSMLTSRPKTKLLVDGGDPEETLRIKTLIGFVDGQTTNPSLIAKNPEIQRRLTAGHQLSEQEGVHANGKPLKPIPYKELDLNLPWDSFDLAHELTTKGIQKVVADYQSTLRRSA